MRNIFFLVFLLVVINIFQAFGQSSRDNYFIGTTLSYGLERCDNNDTTCYVAAIMIGDKLMKNNVRYYYPCVFDENSFKIDISGETEIIDKLNRIITIDLINRISKCTPHDGSCFLAVSINKFDQPIVGRIEERSINECGEQNNEVYELIDIFKYLRAKYNN